MKKIFLLLTLILSAFISKAQFLNNATISNATTNYKALGGLSAGVGMIETNYSDSVAANLNSYLKGISGARFYSTSENATYVRNSTASRWDKQAKYSELTFGTVTSVASGNGMNFSTITGTGTVTLGTPSSVTLASTNSLTSNSHTHLFAPGGTSSQVILGNGTLGTLPIGTVTSVGLTVPSPSSPAFSVSGSPVTGAGVLAIAALGTTSQVVLGNGSLGTLPVLTNEWHLTGNAGTTAGTNYLGTSDAVNLQLRTGGSKRFTINTNGAFGLGTGEDYGTAGYLLSTNGSSTAPTWVNPSSLITNIYNSDGTLAGDRSVNLGGNDLEFTGGAGTSNYTVGNVLTYGVSAAGGGNFGLTSTETQFTSPVAGNRSSQIILNIDTIKLYPSLGNLKIDTLNASNDASDSMMVWTKAAGANRGKVGYRAIPTGGGGISGSGTAEYLTIWNGTSSVNARNFYLGAGNELSADNDFKMLAGTKIFQIGSSADQFIKIDPSGLNQWHVQPNPFMIDTQGDVSIGDYGTGSMDNTGFGIRSNNAFANSYAGFAGLGDIDVVVNGNVVKVVDGSNLAYYDNAAHTGKFLINQTSASNITSGLEMTGELSMIATTNELQVNAGTFNIGDGNSAATCFITGTIGAGLVMGSTTNTNVIGNVQFGSYGAGALVTDGSGNITATSDFRVKHSVEPFLFGLRHVKKITPKTYIRNADATNNIEAGFIAQNIKEVFGGLGVGKDSKGFLTLNTNVVMAALVNGEKELSDTNDAQDKLIKAQQKQIDDLKKQIVLLAKKINKK